VRSDKVMLPESMMDDLEELRAWVGLAFKTAAALPKKVEKAAPAIGGRAALKKPAAKQPSRRKPITKNLKRK